MQSFYKIEFEFSKTDITGDGELVGAKLSVLDKDGKVIDTWTSTEKTHKIEGLVVGNKYILKEEIAPNSYVKATSIEFEVKNTKEIQKVTMIDKIVEMSKKDIAGDEIEGATIQVKDQDGNIIDEWKSGKEPHKINGLEENKKYKLIETTAPYGYELTEEIEFKVTADKETQKIEMKDMPILSNIKIVKIDSKTKEIIKEKFTFGLYADKECTQLIQQMDSNKKEGTVTFEDLRYGTYFIKELSSPKSYEISDEVLKLEINDKGVFINDKEINSEDDAYSFEFENTKIEVPKTGGNIHSTILTGFAGLSVLLLATMGVNEIIKKRKDKKNKKNKKKSK